jgi:hypothetical protein
MNELLQTHLVSGDFLRVNDFEGFIQDRSKQLSQLIERAMGKAVFEESEAVFEL